jgi:hypothetical protein
MLMAEVVIGAVVLCEFALGSEAIPPTPVEGKVQWVYDYDQAKAEARRSGRPLFIVFRCER